MTLTRTKTISIIAIAMVIIVTALVGTYVYLPIFIQKRIIPNLIHKTGFNLNGVRVRHIGFFGADFESLDVSAGDEGGLIIPAIQITYTPWDLLRGRIDKVELVGISTDFTIQHQSICIAGYCLEDRPGESKDQDASFIPDDLLPLIVKRINIRKAEMRFRWRNRTIELPFELALNTEDLKNGDLSGHIALSPRGQKIDVDFKAGNEKNKARIDLNTLGLQTQYFSDFLQELLPLDLSAAVDVQAVLALSLHPLNLIELTIQADLMNMTAGLDGLILESPKTVKNGPNYGEQTEEPSATQIQITTRDIHNWQISSGSLTLTTPLTLKFTGFEADLTFSEEDWTITGIGQSYLPDQSLDLVSNVVLDQPVDLTWRFQVKSAPADRIDYQINADISENSTVNLNLAGIRLISRAFKAVASGDIKDGAINGRLSIKGGPLKGQLPHGSLKSQGFSLKTNMTYVEHWVFDSTLDMQEPVLELGSHNMKAPEVLLKARIEVPSEGPELIASHFQFENGELIDRERNLVIRNIALDIPLQWPIPEAVSQGSLSAHSLQWGSHDLGGLSGVLTQSEKDITADMIHTSRLFPGLRLNIRTILNPRKIRIHLNVPSYEPDTDIHLGKFFAAASNFWINGNISAEADFQLTSESVHGTADIILKRGRLQNEGKGIALDGITCALTMDDLPNLRSAPQQSFQASTVQIGQVLAEDLNVNFQIEPQNTLFIEKADLKWCQGFLNTQSFRIHPDSTGISTTLFCSRLNLAELLDQLGVAEGTGDGAVNGRIPIRWTKGLPVFDDGFLFSTPGQSGTIRLTGTSYLLSGLPEGTPQYTQLDIATEALKDYTYNWAKVGLDTQEDMLIVNLKLDGRPNRLMPFAYDQKMGQLIRVKGKGQAEFKGISIDLNFQSPLDRILRYKELLTPNNRNG